MLWPGIIEVHPHRRDENGRILLETPGHGRNAEIGRRVLALLSHERAPSMIRALHIESTSVRIEACVPRFSDDADADAQRVEKFLTAVYLGEPVEG